MTSRFWGASKNGLLGGFQGGGSVAAPTSTALLTGGTQGSGTANRSQYLATSAAALTFSSAVDVGAAELVRANAAQSQTKSHWEWKPVSLNTTNPGAIFMGITDVATVSFTSFLAANRYPGQTDGTTPVPGFMAVLFGNDLTHVQIFANAAAANVIALGATWQLNADALVFENDKTASANVCKVYFWDNSAGTSTLLQTVTLSGSYVLPTSTYAFGGGAWSTGGPDSATVNFGASANLVTPTAGFSIYA